MRRASLLLALLLPGLAHAYPWMIRHGYTGCAACHDDPSGSGLLNAYGRAQQQLLLPTRWTNREVPEEAAPGLLYGAIPLPEWLDLGVSLRGALFQSSMQPGTSTFRDIDMITDLRAGVHLGPVLAVATVGYLPTGGRLAALTDRPKDNIVSREHWVGLELLDRRLVVQAGRMNVPFGLRNVEHPTWVRATTRTDTDSSQQYGVTVSWNGPGLRAALMGIAGNYLLRRPEYREHGAAGYVEGALAERFTLGVSSLVTHADRSLASISSNGFNDRFADRTDAWRQAHGLFGRWAATDAVVVLAEADLLVQTAANVARDVGGVGLVQVDLEPIQGLHLIGTGEALRQYGQPGWGLWGGVSWFPLAYVETRVDVVWNDVGTSQGVVKVLSVLAQLHLSM